MEDRVIMMDTSTIYKGSNPPPGTKMCGGIKIKRGTRMKGESVARGVKGEGSMRVQCTDLMENIKNIFSHCR